MSQRTSPRNSSSPTDEPHPSTNHRNGSDNSSTNPSKPMSRSLRPYSTPSAAVASNSPSLSQPPMLSSGASISSSNTGSTRKTAPRPSTVVRPGMRPKTSYQAVTWKENLDAFNRRLRRGSLSLDAAAQEEEMLAQAVSQAKTHQQDHTRHRDHDSIHGRSSITYESGVGQGDPGATITNTYTQESSFLSVFSEQLMTSSCSIPFLLPL